MRHQRLLLRLTQLVLLRRVADVVAAAVVVAARDVVVRRLLLMIPRLPLAAAGVAVDSVAAECQIRPRARES